LKKKVSWRILVLWSVTFVIFAASVFTGLRNINTIRENNERIEEYEKKAVTLQDIIDELTYKVRSMTKEELEEELARENHYVYEDETWYHNSAPGA